jgi:nucleotide-binding universal stress UspA family protein
MPSSTSQPKKRKTRKRAVLQFRIPQAEYRELAKAAKDRDRTISEEAASRLSAFVASKEFEKAMTVMEKSWTEAQQEQRLRDAARELESLGYKKVDGRDVWLGPDEQLPLIVSRAELEEFLMEAAKLGAELAIKESNK